MIRGWKNCILIVTYQGHVLLIENEESSTVDKNEISINLDNDTIKKNIKEIECAKGIMECRLLNQYSKNNLCCVKLFSSKSGGFLFQIWKTEFNSDKKYNICTLDALNDENRERIFVVLCDGGIK